MQPFAHREFDTAMLFKVGLYANALTAASTINTYNTGQLGEAIDSWNAGRMFPRKVLVLINVGAVSGSGTLTVSFRDDGADLTNANGDANSGAVCSFTAIEEIGQYYAEVNLDHVFTGVADAASYIERYHSIRAVAADCNFTFSVDLLYGFYDGKPPSQSATELTTTYE